MWKFSQISKLTQLHSTDTREITPVPTFAAVTSIPQTPTKQNFENTPYCTFGEKEQQQVLKSSQPKSNVECEGKIRNNQLTSLCLASLPVDDVCNCKQRVLSISISVICRVLVSVCRYLFVGLVFPNLMSWRGCIHDPDFMPLSFSLSFSPASFVPFIPHSPSPSSLVATCRSPVVHSLSLPWVRSFPLLATWFRKRGKSFLLLEGSGCSNYLCALSCEDSLGYPSMLTYSQDCKSSHSIRITTAKVVWLLLNPKP